MAKKSSSKLIRDLNILQGGDWQGLAEELHTGTDRATAILGGVFLDEQLQRLIENFLVDEKEVRDGLFGVEQPIGTFSARIKIAYGFGLINKELKVDLDRIRQIRNVFAHTLHGLSFSQNDISEWCKALEMPKRLIPDYMGISHPRMLYISGVLFAASYLQAKTSQIAQVRRTVPEDAFYIQWNPVGNPSEVKPNNPYIAVVSQEEEPSSTD